MWNMYFVGRILCRIDMDAATLLRKLFCSDRASGHSRQRTVHALDTGETMMLGNSLKIVYEHYLARLMAHRQSR